MLVARLAAKAIAAGVAGLAAGVAGLAVDLVDLTPLLNR
jgi:hypothetical protein